MFVFMPLPVLQYKNILKNTKNRQAGMCLQTGGMVQKAPPVNVSIV